jgi:hypothetical protein
MPGFFHNSGKSPASEEQSGKIQATFVAVRLRIRRQCGYCFLLASDNSWSHLPASFVAPIRRAGLNFLFVN